MAGVTSPYDPYPDSLMNSQTAAVIAEVRACVGEDSTLERPELMIAFV